MMFDYKPLKTLFFYLGLDFTNKLEVEKYDYF